MPSRLMHLVALVALPMVLLVAAPAQAQAGLDGAAPTLRLSGERDTTLTLQDFARLPQTRVPVAPHRHGNDTAAARAALVYSGVAVVDLLALVGGPREAQLRGRGVASYLLIEAADGYRVVFSLDELAREDAQAPVILADRLNDAPLSPEEGPFRIVAPGVRHSRWIRQVVRLTIRTAAP
ncbi:MAG TPA: molybdopterin-dependent oxidoreductase [Gemmatimonadaceae bacterium]|nr:molybdopterin-dependent oxidoreductase [Gemmatimonadaceae bacterium]